MLGARYGTGARGLLLFRHAAYFNVGAYNWDIERKRYPQYDHTAVIVAEDITSRFLNVIA